MRQIAVLLALVALLGVASAMTKVSNVTNQTANLTINWASSFINLVNQSGYLVFFPNLTQAYADLASAQKLYATSPSSAIGFANKAAAEAGSEYQRISSYRYASVVSMFLLTIFFAFVLARFLKPVRNVKVKKRAKR